MAWKRALACSAGLLWLVVSCTEAWAGTARPSLAARVPGGRGGAHHRRSRTTNLGSSSSSSSPVLGEHRGEASGVFGNLRIPAALFAGASAGAAFALPVAHGGPEGLKVGLVKRLYSLLMMSALSSEILAVVVSTLAMGALAVRPCPPTASVGDLLRDYYDLEWVAARLHFLGGMVLFSVGIGLRAWITIACPIIARAALGVILSSAILCLAFIDETERRPGGVLDGVFSLPFLYVRLLLQRASKKPLFAAGFATWFATLAYILYKSAHIVKYLSAN